MALHQASCWSNRCMTCRGLDRVVAWGQYLETWASVKSSLGALIYTGEFTANHLAYRPFFFPAAFLGAGQRLCMLDLQKVRDLFLKGRE